MLQALAEQLVNGLMMGGVYVLVALGMMLIYGVMHVLNFAHGVLFTVGGYVAHTLFVHVFGNYVAALAGSMVVLILLGLLLESWVFGPLRDNLRNQVIASLGLILAVENLIVVLWGPTALSFKVSATELLVPIGVLRFSLQHILIILVSLGSVALLWGFLGHTRIGTALRATSQHREAALLVGVDVRLMYRLAFAIGAALAALGGALLGPLFLVYPQMGDLPLVKGLAGILIGGMGSLWGAVLGGLLIGVVEAVSTLFIATDWKDAVTFLAIAAVLLLRPQGLFGVRVRGED